VTARVTSVHTLFRTLAVPRFRNGVTLDLHSPLKVVSWASAHADCPMRYEINGADEMVTTFGSGSEEFEFAFDASALHTLVQLSAEALDKMTPAWRSGWAS
jgi:hypothetical protein